MLVVTATSPRPDTRKSASQLEAWTALIKLTLQGATVMIAWFTQVLAPKYAYRPQGHAVAQGTAALPSCPVAIWETLLPNWHD
jgi:hypothetical protein